MIRTATINDLDQFSDMAKAFAEVRGRAEFNRPVFLATWKNLIESGCGHVWGRFRDDKPVETIAAIVYPDPFDGVVCAYVAFWHFEENATGLEGGFLFREMLDDLKKRGVGRLFYAALTDGRFPRVARFLSGAGFTPVEMNFRKDL